MNAFHQHDRVDIMFTEFSKAFDRVDHTLFLTILDKYSFEKSLLF